MHRQQHSPNNEAALRRGKEKKTVRYDAGTKRTNRALKSDKIAALFRKVGW